jgi:UTP--glucose-1-phosphate uridylyltransferase
LLPFSKELPKEMAPVFTHGKNGVEIKPLLQQIFENLYLDGLRDFCFVTGRTKRSIEDHFSPDLTFDTIPKQLHGFYEMLRSSNMLWVNQLEPKGFGDAVYTSRTYVSNSNFILHAGDVSILSKKTNPISKLLSLERNNHIEAAILLKQVEDPERHGIATVNDNGKFINVSKVIEKPDKPKSNLGIMPIYLFRRSIFHALEKTKPGKNDEIQLTDAIQKLITSGKKVVGIRVDDDIVLDVGTPESFWRALNQSYNLLPSGKKF